MRRTTPEASCLLVSCCNGLVRLDQVTVGATNLDRSEAFYRALGLRVIVKDEHYLRFECPVGASTFSVDLVDSVPEFEEVTVYFEIDDVDTAYERLQRDGIAFEQPPTDMPWLWREARLRDPDGHRLCIFHGGENRLNPPWRVSPA
jgi:catechol 2,3-dioxygenase-like lactoylglutathione lyase family enzyme